MLLFYPFIDVISEQKAASSFFVTINTAYLFVSRNTLLWFMFIRRENRDEILKELFTQGVLVCKKEFAKHTKLDVPNLEIINLMRSFKAKKLVDETYCWKHFYWVLTEAGIEHIRELLHLKPNVVPDVMKPGAREGATEGRDNAERERPRGGRGRGAAYRG